eukprot:9655164-Ditylum_brightwellii.AAC.1
MLGGIIELVQVKAGVKLYLFKWWDGVAGEEDGGIEEIREGECNMAVDNGGVLLPATIIIITKS